MCTLLYNLRLSTQTCGVHTMLGSVVLLFIYTVSSYCRTNSDQLEPKEDNLHEPHNNMIISVMSVLAKWFTTFLKWASWWMFMSKFLLKGISYHNCNAHELNLVHIDYMVAQYSKTCNQYSLLSFCSPLLFPEAAPASPAHSQCHYPVPAVSGIVVVDFTCIIFRDVWWRQ